jgi:SAM-dependent methyltransferase
MARDERERWDRRYAEGGHADGEPPAWLDEVELPLELPRGGRALDVAAGVGRVALWLAHRGLDVTAVDISPVALDRLRRRAAAQGLAVETRALDLESEPLPEGPWDLITCFHFLRRELFPELVARLASGGLLVVEIATERNLERHAKPSRRFLLRSGELVDLLEPLRLVYYREGWFEDHAQARAIAARV